MRRFFFSSSDSQEASPYELKSLLNIKDQEKSPQIEVQISRKCGLVQLSESPNKETLEKYRYPQYILTDTSLLYFNPNDSCDLVPINMTAENLQNLRDYFSRLHAIEPSRDSCIVNMKVEGYIQIERLSDKDLEEIHRLSGHIRDKHAIHFSHLQQLKPLLKQAIQETPYFPDRVGETYASVLQMCSHFLCCSIPVFCLTAFFIGVYFINKWLTTMSDEALSNWHTSLNSRNQICASAYGSSRCITSYDGGINQINVAGISREEEPVCFDALYCLCSRACDLMPNSIIPATQCTGQSTRQIIGVDISLFFALIFCCFMLALKSQNPSKLCRYGLIRNTEHYDEVMEQVATRAEQQRLNFFNTNDALLKNAGMIGSAGFTLIEILSCVETKLELAEPFVSIAQECRNGLNGAAALVDLIEEYAGASVLFRR